MNSTASKVRRVSPENRSEANDPYGQGEGSWNPTQAVKEATQSVSARKIGDIPNPTVKEWLLFHRYAILSTIFQMLPCKECFEWQLECQNDSSCPNELVVPHACFSPANHVDGLKHFYLKENGVYF